MSCAGARRSLEAIAAVWYSSITGIARNLNRRFTVKKNEKIEKPAREIKNQALDKVRGGGKHPMAKATFSL